MQSGFVICKANELFNYVPDRDPIHSRRETYCIILTRHETVSLYLKKKLEIIPSHSILFVSPSCLLAVDETSINMDVLCFNATFYNRSNHDSQFLQDTPLFPDAGYFIYHIPMFYRSYVDYIVHMLYDASTKLGNSLYQALSHNLVEQVMLQCALHGEAAKAFNFIDDGDHIITMKFRELISLYIKKSRSVKYYADKLNITTRRLSKAVNNVLGKTPKDVLTDYVIDQFKWLLVYSDQSIKEMGREYGFLDENNFSSFFSKEVGMTPKEYRKSGRLKNA